MHVFSVQIGHLRQKSTAITRWEQEEDSPLALLCCSGLFGKEPTTPSSHQNSRYESRHVVDKCSVENMVRVSFFVCLVFCSGNCGQQSQPVYRLRPA